MIKESTMEKTSLPDGWEMKTLGEICVINPKKIEVNNLPANHLVSFLPMKDLGVAQNQINPITIKQLSEVKGSYTYFRNNDVLLAKVTPCFENGKLGIAKNLKNEIGFGSSEYIVFRPKNELLSEYLFYILSSSKFRNRGKELMYGAVGLKRLSKDYVKNFITPFPSIEKQKQIVAILDKAFAAIDTAKANAEQNLQNAKELFESYLQNVFENKGDDWEEKTLEDVCESISAGGDKPKELSKFKTEKFNIPIYANGEKNKGLYGFTNVAKILEPSITISGRGTIGYSEIRNEPFTPIVRLIVLIPNKEKIDINFLKYIVSNIDFINSGSSIPQLTVPMVKGYKVTYPIINEQNDIVQKLDALSADTKKLEAIYTQKIADLEEMKKSVLQKAFAGQLNTIN